MAEVEVIEKTTKKNVAYRKKTNQSSTGWSAPSSRAVDGNTNGNFWARTSTHTINSNAWWEIDLGKEYDIHEIKIYNRTDCCQTRINNSVIKLLHSNRKLFKAINYGINSPIKSFFV